MLNPPSPKREGNIINYPNCGRDSVLAQGWEQHLHIQPGTRNSSRPPSVKMEREEEMLNSVQIPWKSHSSYLELPKLSTSKYVGLMKVALKQLKSETVNLWLTTMSLDVILEDKEGSGCNSGRQGRETEGKQRTHLQQHNSVSYKLLNCTI